MTADDLLAACRAVCEAEDTLVDMTRYCDQEGIDVARQRVQSATARRDHAMRQWYAHVTRGGTDA